MQTTPRLESRELSCLAHLEMDLLGEMAPTYLFETKGDQWVHVHHHRHHESLYLAGADALGVACLKDSCLKSGAVFRANFGPRGSSPALLGVLA